ncbi:glycosyltransferase family 61 protein [Nocardioides sp. GXZ039]|uniref:glycosyltransferase family 61 protein n=1 Tax=Nocardioides sp. GXZ039 TaxID=3136018 RepID=UPI0030F49897
MQVPSLPLEPLDVPSVQTIEGAHLSPWELGQLRTIGRPNRYLRGAVYDGSGRLVESSQKFAVPGHPWVAADPSNLRLGGRMREHAGTWLYGGHWIQHFGHFLVETLTTLWPDVPGLDGLVFHKYLRGTTEPEPWMRRLLDLAGFADLPVSIVGARRAAHVERLVVPSRAVVANGWGHPQAAEVWRRIAAPFAPTRSPSARIYLSRTRFNQARRADDPGRDRSTPERDRALDALFARAGFDVVAPELLSIDDQIRCMAGARIVAGSSGSALHLTALAPPGTAVLEIGDSRSPHRPVPMQLIIDHLLEHPHQFLPATDDLDAVERAVSRLPGG